MYEFFRHRSLSRFLFVTTALVLIWFVWTPEYRELPEHLMVVSDVSTLQQLPENTAFLLPGTVDLLNSADSLEWQQRIAYLHRQRIDARGTSGKSVPPVTLVNYRPALEFVTGQQALILPAESYHLDHAPRVIPRQWPRKWLWSTRVDDWDRSSRGFMKNDQALALGYVGAAGALQITALMHPSMDVVRSELGSENRTRRWLILAARLVITVFLLSLLQGLAPAKGCR